VYVPTPVQPPESPRVRELSQRIQQLISDFQRQYPMTPAEIRQALQHAAGPVGGDQRRVLAVVAGGLAAALGVGVFVATERGAEISAMPIAVAVGILAMLVGLVRAVRRNR